MRPSPWIWLLPLLAVDAAAQSAAAPAQYDVAPPPAWVRLATPVASEASAEKAYGAEILLLDRQSRADVNSTFYMRAVVHLLSAQGVTDYSQLSLNFDPQTERLTVHSVTLHRGTESVDELKQGRVEVLQREAGLEQGVMSGELTFHLTLNDVRVGDTIDYSFSVERRAPEWGNRFYGTYSRVWSVPVRQSRLLVSRREKSPLYVRDANDVVPASTTDADWQNLEWTWHDVAALPSENGTPGWYERYATVQLSQFAGWAELAAVAMPLYSVTEKPTAELNALIERMRAVGPSDAERTVAVMRFVQDEIRYTGVESGISAFRPSSPAQVLQRRWGDCKDKTLLAVTVLRALGIEAQPALVSTRWRAHLHERLPSPEVFNHAIVRARVRGETYWFDATTSAQGGDLARFTQSDLGEALVIAEGTKDLETMHSELPKEPREVVTAVLDVRAGEHEPAVFSVSSEYRLASADRMRRALRDTTLEQVGHTYLEYYHGRYPGISQLAPLQVHDDLQANTLTVSESYRVENLFEKQKDGREAFEIEAELVNGLLKSPGTSIRTTPLGLAFPTDVQQKLTMRFPSEYTVKSDVVSIETPSFHYESRLARSGNDVIVDYRYRTLSDQVPPTELADFLKKREEARQDTYLTFHRGATEGPSSAELAAAQRQLKEVAQLTETKAFDKADRAMSELLKSPGFAGMSGAQRHSALFLGGWIALTQKDGARAQDLARRACAMEEAKADDWNLRVSAAVMSEDYADATRALETIARRWPDSLAQVDVDVVALTVRRAPTAGTTRYDLLSALFDAHYARTGFDGSPWWRDLALLQLERGEEARATAAVAHITDPYTLVSIRADSRFNPVRAGVPQLDIQAAAAKAIDKARAQAAKEPNVLERTNDLFSLLLAAARLEEALAVTDAALARLSNSEPRKRCTDCDQQYVWLLDNRSRALLALGRRDEAIAQEQSASHLKERGSASNVSQVINLAEFYALVNRPAEARAALAGLQQGTMSAYGEMQRAEVQLVAALQLGDTKESERTLSFMREHQQDALDTYQWALVMAARDEDAARLLISRLGNPEQRTRALLQSQQYCDDMDERLPPFTLERRKHWLALLKRSDVQEAIQRVGSSDSYPLTR